MDRMIYGLVLLTSGWVALPQAGGLIRQVAHPSTGWLWVLNLGAIVLWGLALFIAYRGMRYGSPGKRLVYVTAGLSVALVVTQALVRRLG